MPAFTVDIELTNRCNAKCYFCPRDQTPHQGLMSTEVFDQSLARAVEYYDLLHERLGVEPPSVSLCGLGEPLLNKHAAQFVAQVRETPLGCQMSSNGALLDERRGRAILDAGLQRIFLNVGERGEDYDDIYKLPFEKTCENVVRFNEMAGDDCDVYIVLVDHRRDPEHQEAMREFWRGHGIDLFSEFAIMNRGGALFVDHMQYESYPELHEARRMLEERGTLPLCGAPFAYLFIGYDGQYYLCCSDWKKEVPFGSVFDTSFEAIIRPKLEAVVTREPICKTCNLDPVNMLADELRAVSDGDKGHEAADSFADETVTVGNAIIAALEKITPGVTVGLDDIDAAPPKRLIPVSAQ
jgi:MoaA/NifB/PqqE/SkfB family radical SAM enzyme